MINKLERKEKQTQQLEEELKSTKEKLNTFEIEAKDRMHSQHNSTQNTNAIQLDLQLKEELLKDTLEKYKFSEGNINKMEEFIRVQKGKIEHLEEICEKNNQVRSVN